MDDGRPVEDTMSAPNTARIAQRTRFRTAIHTAALALIALSLAACTDIVGVSDRDLEIIWPRQGAVLYDHEMLRARVRHRHLDDYDIYWYVDDSRERRMWDEWDARTPHKAYLVDTWHWNWRGRGPYTVGFVAEDYRGRVIARRTVRVYVE
jgi:hypothetical protein